jgi:predicted metal-binding membrane protein
VAVIEQDEAAPVRDAPRAAAGRTASGRGLPSLPLVVSGVAWMVITVLLVSGRGDLLGHGGADLPVPVRPLLALGAWQLMVAAMMLPSTGPMWSAFAGLAARRPRPSLARASLLAGYASVWGAFGVAAYGLDLVVHRAVEAVPWLAARTWVLVGLVLLLAGAAQLLPLTQACLRSCRHPVAYLLHHFRPGAAAAFRLGQAYGLSCLGCCWALMTVAFATGAVHLGLMAGLAALMAYEKLGRHGERVALATGAALLALGALVLVAGGSTLLLPGGKVAP